MTIGGFTQSVVPHNAFTSDDVADEALLDKLRKEVKVFSVVDLQRLCFWSYNQAARKLDQFVSLGFVKKHEKTPWLFVAIPVLPTSVRSACPHCGGDLLGDGFSTLIRCENYAGDVDVAPDSGPFFCGGQQS